MSDYIKLQTEKYLSHESQQPKWIEGQKRCIDYMFQDTLKDSAILDAGCGDGIGLKYLATLEYTNLTGVDLSSEKTECAQEDAPENIWILEGDLHDLSMLKHRIWDVIYSSHSLEHCHDPVKVVSNFRQLLVPNGKLKIVLPYPDRGPKDAHCGSDILGTRISDEGHGVVTWFKNQGFETTEIMFDSFREPEIWLNLIRR